MVIGFDGHDMARISPELNRAFQNRWLKRSVKLELKWDEQKVSWLVVTCVLTAAAIGSIVGGFYLLAWCWCLPIPIIWGDWWRRRKAHRLELIRLKILGD